MYKNVLIYTVLCSLVSKVWAFTAEQYALLFIIMYHNVLITSSSYYKSSSVCLYVCLSVCLFVPYLLRDPLTDLRQTWWVYVVGPRNCLEGFFFEKVNGSMGQRVTFTFHYIIYAPASCHTLQRLLLLAAVPAPESNSAPFARRVLHCISTVYIGGPWGVLFLKGQWVDGSTGRRVNGSMGQTGRRAMGQMGRRLTSRRCM